MRVLLRYSLAAALLAVAGVGLYRTGRLQSREAAAYRQLLTLEFERPLAEYGDLGRDLRYVGAMPGFDTIARGLRVQRATSSYWRRRFDELTLPTSVTGETTERDPLLRLMAANAAYRQAAPDDTGPGGVQRLEAVLALYGDVLRLPDWQFDAAYNYEFAARRRDALIKLGSARAARTPEKRDPVPAGPSGTIHGRAGAVPPGTDMTDFKIIVPQRSDERREQPEAGKGGPKARKG